MLRIIPKSILELHRIFSNNNKKLFVVGGSVRDYYMGYNPKDFDLATDAHPDDIIDMLSDRYEMKYVGKAFGVVIVFTEDQPLGMEIATFRKDLYDDKLGLTRKPGVEFTTIDEDVKRRDITINSMFYDISNDVVIDLVNGLSDIENKIIRFVGDPVLRIVEDPLRMLRVCRFSNKYDFEIDSDSLEAIKNNSNKLTLLSKEQIKDEFHKGFEQSKNKIKYLNLLKDTELIKYIFEFDNLNLNFIDSDNIIIQISNILIHNHNLSHLDRILILKFKFDSKTVQSILFLLSLIDFKSNDILDYYKRKNSYNIDNNLINEWISIISNDDLKHFNKFKQTITSEELIQKGFVGKSLGIEMKRIEFENYLKLF